MKSQAKQNDENKVRLLYKELLESWNNHNAGQFANLFAEDANSIGFDGSQMNGRGQINDEISQVFANHKVSSYVGCKRGSPAKLNRFCSPCSCRDGSPGRIRNQSGS